MPSNSQPTPRKWLKPTLVWTLIIVPPVLLMLAVGAWYSESLKLDAKLAALRAAGQPTTAAEVNDFYTVPEGVADTTELWVQAIDGVVAADISERGKPLPYFGFEEAAPIPPPGEEWAQLEESRSFVAELDDELQAVWKAAAVGGQARYPVDFRAGTATLVSYAQNGRQAVRLLSLDAQVAAHDGDDTRALRDIKAMYAISNTLRGEPFVVSQFVRFAIHAIGQSQIELLLPYCDWNDTELHSLQAAILSAQFKQELQHAISGERAICLSELGHNFHGPFWVTNKLELLQFFEIYQDRLEGDWNETLQWQRQYSAELLSRGSSNLGRRRVIAALMIALPFELTTTGGGRTAARQKTTVIAIAAQRHRLKHGQLPTLLSEIAPELLGSNASALFSDPFTDKQLLFKSDDSQIIIYSVGENQQDDGGNVDLENVPRDKQDIGFKLPR